MPDAPPPPPIVSRVIAHGAIRYHFLRAGDPAAPDTKVKVWRGLMAPPTPPTCDHPDSIPAKVARRTPIFMHRWWPSSHAKV